MLQLNPIIAITAAITVLFIGLPERSCKDQNQSGTPRESGTPKMEITKVAEGVWGGPHIIMEVTADSAVITYDCAVGTIDEPIKIDKDGRFAVRGTLTRQRGGSVRSDETPDRQTARYVGRVESKSMTLVVTLPNKKETEGTFYLKHGERPELTRCM
ncbi:MAG: hypothetical protein ND866_03375 [Pyrinomonadaceae bacterium]|nr:hypothetical protein [Pyrinomonadaceae bacterium]